MWQLWEVTEGEKLQQLWGYYDDKFQAEANIPEKALWENSTFHILYEDDVPEYWHTATNAWQDKIVYKD